MTIDPNGASIGTGAGRAAQSIGFTRGKLINGCPAWLDPGQFQKRNELPLRRGLGLAISDLRMSIAPDAEKYLEDDYRAALDLLCDLAAGMGIGLSTLIPDVMDHFCVSVSDIAQGYMDGREAYKDE